MRKIKSVEIGNNIQDNVQELVTKISQMLDVVRSEDKTLQRRELALLNALSYLPDYLQSATKEQGPASSRMESFAELVGDTHCVIPQFLEAIPLFFEAVLREVHGGAFYALRPASVIKNTHNSAIIQEALPFLARALFPASETPDNFGRLACDYLDMGGDIKALIDPVKLILRSQEYELYGKNPGSPEERLARHLCCEGFISFLNHPRLKESPELTNLLRPFAGQIIPDQRKEMLELLRSNACVLVSLQGDMPAFVWGARTGGLRYTPIRDLRGFKAGFNDYAGTGAVAVVARDLFQAKQNDRFVGKVARGAVRATRDWGLG